VKPLRLLLSFLQRCLKAIEAGDGVLLPCVQPAVLSVLGLSAANPYMDLDGTALANTPGYHRRWSPKTFV
jgi:hypothetical protein